MDRLPLRGIADTTRRVSGATGAADSRVAKSLPGFALLTGHVQAGAAPRRMAGRLHPGARQSDGNRSASWAGSNLAFSSELRHALSHSRDADATMHPGALVPP